MIDIVKFFEKQFETGVNESLFYRNYVLEESEIKDYISHLLNEPISTYLDYIVNKSVVTHLSSTSVVQYSSIYDATNKLCTKFAQSGDNGLTFIEIGKMLLDDNIPRKDGAYRKYGENHVKLAIEFGLTQVCYDYFYLTCIGIIYPSLEEQSQKELLRRTILRNNFVQRLLKLSSEGRCSIAEQLSFLSESTIKRRMSNIKSLFQLIQGDDGMADSYLKNISELNL